MGMKAQHMDDVIPLGEKRNQRLALGRKKDVAPETL
jgi:hypothetical protein